MSYEVKLIADIFSATILFAVPLLLVAMGGHSPLGQWFAALTGHTLAFSFTGLVVASVIFNIPFAVQPMQRAFEAIPTNIRDAAACCGLSRWRTLFAVELPLAWPGIVSAIVLTSTSIIPAKRVARYRSSSSTRPRSTHSRLWPERSR